MFLAPSPDLGRSAPPPPPSLAPAPGLRRRWLCTCPGSPPTPAWAPTTLMWFLLPVLHLACTWRADLRLPCLPSAVLSPPTLSPLLSSTAALIPTASRFCHPTPASAFRGAGSQGLEAAPEVPAPACSPGEEQRAPECPTCSPLPTGQHLMGSTSTAGQLRLTARHPQIADHWPSLHFTGRWWRHPEIPQEGWATPDDLHGCILDTQLSGSSPHSLTEPFRVFHSECLGHWWLHRTA